jgi:hypothetical protein
MYSLPNNQATLNQSTRTYQVLIGYHTAGGFLSINIVIIAHPPQPVLFPSSLLGLDV